jgi:uncharacterized protein (TIGR02145 family)
MKTRPLLALTISVVLISITACIKEEEPPSDKQLVTAVSLVFPKVESDEDSNPDLEYGSVTDIDGNIYKTIQIGYQTWLADNLKVTKYNDGSQIYYESNGGPAGYTDWFGLEKGAYCWFDNDPDTYRRLGAIYNWKAVESGKLCPAGWHVPEYSEWTELATSLGGVVAPFSEETDNAYISYVSEGRIREYGFNPIVGGCLHGFGFLGPSGSYYFWWTATPYIKYNFPYAFIFSFSIISDEPQSYGYNVRCVKD